MFYFLVVGIKVFKFFYDCFELGLVCSVFEIVEVYIFMMCIL